MFRQISKRSMLCLGKSCQPLSSAQFQWLRHNVQIEYFSTQESNNNKNNDDSTPTKPRILFVCVANSCRSQMADVLGTKYLSDIFDVYSAGARPTSPNPRAMQLMKSKGEDVDRLHSKSLEDIPVPVEYAVSLCNGNDLGCPLLVGNVNQYLDWEQPDPVSAQGTEDEINQVYESVYNQIEQLVVDFRKEYLAKQQELNDQTKKYQ